MYSTLSDRPRRWVLHFTSGVSLALWHHRDSDHRVRGSLAAGFIDPVTFLAGTAALLTGGSIPSTALRFA